MLDGLPGKLVFFLFWGPSFWGRIYMLWVESYYATEAVAIELKYWLTGLGLSFLG